MKSIFYKSYYFFFTLIGGRIYLKWLLPTNPATNNPLFKLFYPKSIRRIYLRDGFDVRLAGCFVFGILHIIMGIWYTISDSSFFTMQNILGNVYPILVQIYVGLRCKQVLDKRQVVHNSQTLFSQTVASDGI